MSAKLKFKELKNIGGLVATPEDVGKWLVEKDRELLERLGCELKHMALGEARLELTVKQNMLNSGQACQGGIIFSLADQACAYACLSNNQVGATLSADIVYTHPAFLGDTLTANASIVVSKNRTATCDVPITNQKGETIALFRAVWYRKNQAIIEDVNA